MFRFWLSALANAAAWYAFLDWARGQAEGQIDRMQQEAFDTPGAAAPILPAVFVTGAGVLLGHSLLSRALRLGAWRAWFSLILGGAAGAAILVARQQQ